MKSKINQSIFKAYDIRGIASEDFDGGLPEKIGQALVDFTNAKWVVLGWDARTSSPQLCDGVRRGLLSRGVKIIEIGLCTTPMFNFAVASDHQIDAGIMVTASHNPSQYNGFKMVYAGARPISGIRMLDEVLKVEEAGEKTEISGGTVEKREIISDYLSAVLKIARFDAEPNQKLGRIVIDAGNGMVGVPLPEFLKRTNINAKVLFPEVDCSFPNHEANPVKETTLEALKRTVVDEGAAYGVSFDGDADRIGFVDEKGVRIAGDHIGALIAEEILLSAPGSLILGDTNAGWAFREAVEKAGAKFEITPVGHANIKINMRESKALFAAELSYHFYYRDFYNVESTLLTFLLVKRRYAREGKKMSELVAPYRKYFATGEMNIEVKDAPELLKRVRAHYESEANKIFDADGIRMEFDNFWFSLRASNTEPLVRLNLEAKSREEMEMRKTEVLSLIK
ncbi:MAG: phosphomannomutase/phosphoglucomutase [bacterium]